MRPKKDYFWENLLSKQNNLSTRLVPLAGVVPNLDIDQKMKLYLIWGRPITENCCNSLKVVRFASFRAEKILSFQKSSKVCFDEYPLFPTEESKHQMSTKKVGFKVFLKVNAKRNKHRMWLDHAQKQLPNLLNPNTGWFFLTGPPDFQYQNEKQVAANQD